MQSLRTLPVTALAVLLPRVSAQLGETFSFCQEEFCESGDCPFYGSFSQEFPECAVYSATGLQEYGFEGNGAGVFDVFLDIPDLDDGCHWVLRSPASTDVVGCGYVAGTWANGGCDAVQLDDTFMIQYCCGIEDCKKAGVSYPGGKRAAPQGANVGGGAVIAKRSGGGAMTLHHANGTAIEPFQTGLPPEKRGLIDPIEVGLPPELRNGRRGINVDNLVKRQEGIEATGKCKEDSWEADGPAYTRPSQNTQLVATGGSSGQTITIGVTRTTGIETTIGMEMGINIADIVNIGVSFEQSFSKDFSESKERQFQVPEGQQGDVGFTSYLICEEGKGECDGEEVTGEICSPYKDASGELAGLYHIIQRGSSKQ